MTVIMIVPYLQAAPEEEVGVTMGAETLRLNNVLRNLKLGSPVSPRRHRITPSQWELQK